jgi:hypothetical protein
MWLVAECSEMTKKKPTKPKRKPTKRKPREDTNQIAYRVMQEVIRRSAD